MSMVLDSCPCRSQVHSSFRTIISNLGHLQEQRILLKFIYTPKSLLVILLLLCLLLFFLQPPHFGV